MNRGAFVLTWGMVGVWLSLGAPVHALTVTQLEFTKGAVNYDGKHHKVLNRLLEQDGTLTMGRYQAIGEIVPRIDKVCETYSLFSSGFSGASAPSAEVLGAAITADLSALFFAAGRGDAYRVLNIGGLATGLFNPDTKEFSLSWDRVFDSGQYEGQATFFLSGVVHFDVQPVPVPAAAWLFGSGLAGLITLLRHRRSA